MSNWMLDNLVEATGDPPRAPGTFCLTPRRAAAGLQWRQRHRAHSVAGQRALATTDRKVRLLCADKDRASVIFDAVLDDLVALTRIGCPGAPHR